MLSVWCEYLTKFKNKIFSVCGAVSEMQLALKQYIFIWMNEHQVQQDKLKNNVRECIQKFPDSVDNEINNNKHSLRSNTNGYGGKTH
jgi:hypothetical protein